MMKKLLFYLLPLLVLLNTGCLKTTNDTTSVSNYPSGNFTGQFQRVHRNSTTLKYDTLTANLLLSLNPTKGFAITGDTSTVHAGSYGAYAFSTTNAAFADYTFPKSGTLAKVHLEGTYLYSWDGTNLQFLQSNDTLTYYYNFKTTSN